MKEIKAYIRAEKAQEVACALEGAGVPGFTIIEVTAFGTVRVPEKERMSIDFAEKVSPVMKLEVVCSDDDSERLVEVITASSYTGHPGDGMIFVSEVSCAVKIRTGERGETALDPGRVDKE